MTMRSVVLPLVGIFTAIVLSIGVMFFQVSVVKSVETAGALEREREQKVLEWVVKANSQATIRDFIDFPAHLIQYSREAGLDYRLVMAIIQKESQWRPDAVGSSGEIGLMQIMPGTAAEVAKRLNDLDFRPPKRGAAGARLYTDLGTLGAPRENVRYGVEYLRWQVAQYGVSGDALRGYNRAPGMAREHRPRDRYAEDVLLAYLPMTVKLPQ